MNKVLSTWLLVMFLTAICPSVRAQHAQRIAKIGWLSGTDAGSSTAEAFFQGLRDLRYVEGKNILIERRFAAGDRARQRAYAAELARLKIDIIVTSSGGDTRAANEATSTIPIVMAQADDPVASGFVASLSHPGGNITGLSTLSPELSGKRLELAKEILPKLSRVAVFGTTSSPGNALVLKEVRLAAAALGLNVQFIDVLAPKDFDDGGLISYGVDLRDMARRAVTYVDKIFKGTKPADLPVEQPMKFELVINLKAAKQIGVTIEPNLLVRADRVIR